MLRENRELNPIIYDKDHIEIVTQAVVQNFSGYFATFAPDRPTVKSRMSEALEKFKKEQPQYQQIFDEDALDDYEYDPNSFKTVLKSKCPIIRRCLNSQTELMDDYRRAFYQTSGQDMLVVTRAIITFGGVFVQNFNVTRHLSAMPRDLGVTKLDDEEYTAYGMIGGGVRSHFLYQLYPHVFPNRSQNSIWSLFF